MQNANPGSFLPLPTRRNILQSTGLAAGSLFLPSLLGDKQAYAAGPTKRLVVLTTNHGPPFPYWKMRRPGLDDSRTAEWEFPLDDPDPMSFSEVLRDLHPHRKDLLVLEGLSYMAAIAETQRAANAHTGPGLYGRLTGAAYPAVGPSFDQLVAAQIGAGTAFKYLNYVNSYDSSPVRDLSGKEVSPGIAIDPLAEYDRIFGKIGLPAPMPTGPLTPQQIAQRREASLLDFVKTRYTAATKRLSGEDKLKIDQHLAMLGDLRNQVMTFQEITCAKPTAPVAGRPGWVAAADGIMSLFPVAMACDLTRVAVFQHWDLPPDAFGAPAGKNTHDDIAHASDDANAAKQETVWMKQYYQRHAKQFANLIAAFKSVREGNGTMLDNSVLVWIPELANGKHDYFSTRIVVAGGGAGAFRTGRYLKYAETDPNPFKNEYGNLPAGNFGSTTFGLGPAVNKLYVSIMQAMGVNQNAIGMQSAVGVGYKKGMPIDTTGPLPRLA